MAMIKSSESGLRARGAAVFDLGDLQREAQSLRGAALADSERIMREARLDAARVRQEAEASGYQEGLARGREEGLTRGAEEGRSAAFGETLERLQALASGWVAALDRWEADRAAMLTAARDDVIALALAIARRVTHRAIRCDPSVIARQLGEALALVCRPTAATVRVHPEDRPALEAALPALLARFQQCSDAALVDDPEIARGGCVVTTTGGAIDATVNRQLDRLAEALLPDGGASRCEPADDSPQ